MMNNQIKIGIIAAGIAVAAIGLGSFALSQNEEMNSRSDQTQMMGSGMTMNSLSTLKGDAFDEAFINDMVEHHVGAVAMAQLVDTESMNPAIQKLAGDIIIAQSREIADMKSWAEKWGYDLKEPAQSAIDEMTSNMVGKTGGDLDKAFLSDMIAHHMSAIQMATLADSNANHQEIKTLSRQIQDTQMSEIMLMKDYAQQAGYDIDIMDDAHGGGHDR